MSTVEDALQPWHTDGYLMLSSMLLDFTVQWHAGILSDQDAHDCIAIIRDAGKQIREENL
jgi:hypothetical protein